MSHVVNPALLVEEGVLTSAQAQEIIRRSRDLMVSTVVNIILCFGILSAALGLVFYFGDPMPVTVTGGLFLLLGMATLLNADRIYAMIGHAAALIGGGMLLHGAGFELVDSYSAIAGPSLLVLGATAGGLAYTLFKRGPAILRFPSGAIAVLGVGLHLWGGYYWLHEAEGSGLPVILLHGYASVLLVLTGAALNVRLITAAAILPFAQMLDAGTYYFTGAYVFYSREATLTILQMSALVVACLWAAPKLPEHLARHARTLAIMGSVVANLAFLVGSIWGDSVGQSYSDHPRYSEFEDKAIYHATVEAWNAQFLTISEHAFAIVWAALLAAAAISAARNTNRGVMNTAITFGAIHAYTQVFESLEAAPLALAIIGLSAVPVAWGTWRWNQRIAETQ